MEQAKQACIDDENCGYVYDYGCNGATTFNKIELCSVSLDPSDLTEWDGEDCVYELKRSEDLPSKISDLSLWLNVYVYIGIIFFSNRTKLFNLISIQEGKTQINKKIILDDA